MWEDVYFGNTQQEENRIKEIQCKVFILDNGATSVCFFCFVFFFVCVALVLQHIVVNLLDNLCPSVLPSFFLLMSTHCSLQMLWCPTVVVSINVFLQSLDYYPDRCLKKKNYFSSFAVTQPLQCLYSYNKSVQILYFISGHHRNAQTKVLFFASSENA